jgi:phosphoribosylformimino-5-aminoimidazole carboxamide ribotide isomerase
MIIYPAIDLRGGQCVRLRQGDYSQETVFGDDPAAMARLWAEQGAEYIHLVDLDGAKAGHPVNGENVRRIVAELANFQIPCQLGGGLRTENDLEEVFDWGVTRAILGTRALRDPEWLLRMAHRYPYQLVLGIDARDGQVATEGWLKTSTTPAIDLARRCAGWPLAALVYTDISRDGMLTGPNVKAYADLVPAVPLPIIASGGVGSLEDLRSLAHLPLNGCIVGRALYEQRFTLSEAIAEVAGK